MRPNLSNFNFEHLPPFLQEVSKPFQQLALDMNNSLPPGPELDVGLRKLLEAKDCFVRAKLEGMAAKKAREERGG